MTRIEWAPFRLEFPILFGGDIPGSLEVGQGWFYVIWDLCVALETIARQRLKEGHPPMRVQQVKEKLGELRCSVKNCPEEAEALLLSARSKSKFTCEVCGEDGNTHDVNGCHKTLCPFHQLLAKTIDNHRLWD